MSSPERQPPRPAQEEIPSSLINFIRRINRLGPLLRSEEILRSSYFPKASQRFAARLNAEIEESDIELGPNFRPDVLLSKETAFIAINWNEEWVGDTQYKQRSVFIEVFPNGNIFVRGNEFGSTLLTESEWKDKKRVQIQALKKAFRQPMTTYFSVSR